MQVLIIHLCDLHIKSRDNWIIDKSSQLCKAIGSSIRYADFAFVVLSGDITDHGMRSEYQHVTNLFAQVTEQCRIYNEKIQINFILVPGNHDCCFKFANTDKRNALIKNLQKDIQKGLSNPITSDMIDVCTSIQNNFFEFMVSQNNNGELTQVNKLLWIKKFNIGKIPIIFYCYNTAWMVTLDKEPNPIYFPIDRFNKDLFNIKPSIRISVLHHTYNSLEPRTFIKLRSHLENTSDLILTGHHHISSQYVTDKLEGNVIEYLEGDILQDNSNSNVSRFNTILIDIDRTKRAITKFTWNGEIYRAYDKIEYEGKCFVGEEMKEFKIDNEFRNKINGAGAPYSHPRKSDLKLSDIFIYPFIRETTTNGELPIDVRSSTLSKIDQGENKILILGDDKSGKTALCRSLFLDYYNSGYVPILINGENLEHISIEYLDKLVTDTYSKQYTVESLDNFTQLENTKKIIIVDNFDKSKLNPTNRRIFLLNIGSYYPNVIITASTIFEIEDLTSQDEEYTNVLVDYKQYLILQFGHLLRYELIDKWNRIGIDEYISDDTVIRKNDEANNLIKAIIGKNLIPSYPIFLLTLLQTIETGKPHDLAESSYGHYYEYLIRDSLIKVIEKYEDLDAFYTFLIELANSLREKRKRLVAKDDLGKLHAWFIDYYKVSMYSEEVYNLDKIMDKLVKADLIEEDSSLYSFKYRFVYYFFAAKYLANKLSEPSIRDTVTNMISRLYYEEFANIIVFLTHHSKDTSIFTEILGKANSIFSKTKPTMLEADTSHINTLINEIPRSVLNSQSVREYRKHRLATKDKSTPPEKYGREFKTENIPDTHEEVIALDLISQINVACKNIEIIGQILKNYHGSIPGDMQVNLTEEAYLLGLRCLQEFFDLLEAKKENVIKNIAARIVARGIDNGELIEKYSRNILFRIYFAIAYGFIQAIAEYVGAESLSVVINDVLNKYQYLSIRLIDLAIKLNHFKDFPHTDTQEVMDRISSRLLPKSPVHRSKKPSTLYGRLIIKNSLAYFILTEMIETHLYMFDRGYQTRQKICSMVGIEMPKQRLIAQKSVVKKSE